MWLGKGSPVCTLNREVSVVQLGKGSPVHTLLTFLRKVGYCQAVLSFPLSLSPLQLQGCPALPCPLLTEHLIHDSTLSLAPAPALPREGMLWALEPKPVPGGSCCELGGGCAVFINIYFLCGLDHTSLHEQLLPAGACAAQWKQEKQNRLKANTQLLSQQCPHCPTGAPTWQGQSL